MMLGRDGAGHPFWLQSRSDDGPSITAKAPLHRLFVFFGIIGRVLRIVQWWALSTTVPVIFESRCMLSCCTMIPVRRRSARHPVGG